MRFFERVKNTLKLGKDRPTLDETIEEEIAQRSEDPAFLTTEWEKHRRRGLAPEDIDYDMCHVWR